MCASLVGYRSWALYEERSFGARKTVKDRS